MSFTSDLRKEMGGKTASDSNGDYPEIGKDTSGKLDGELGAKGNPFLEKELNREQHIHNSNILKNSQAQTNGAAENKVTLPKPT